MSLLRDVGEGQGNSYGLSLSQYCGQHA